MPKNHRDEGACFVARIFCLPPSLLFQPKCTVYVAYYVLWAFFRSRERYCSPSLPRFPEKQETCTYLHYVSPNMIRRRDHVTLHPGSEDQDVTVKFHDFGLPSPSISKLYSIVLCTPT